MTAPDVRIAEIVAEGRRLEESAAFVGRESVPWEEVMDACARVEAFYAENGPRLLAVAEAAVRYTDALDDYDHTDDGDFVQQRALLTQTEAALRAAVRGEEKTNG